MAQSPLVKARYALQEMKRKHGRNCHCQKCVVWMMAVANARRKQTCG